MAKKRKAVPSLGFAVPPIERAQHDALELKFHDPQSQSARRVQVKLPNRLRKYRALGSITEDHLMAGEALAADWEVAGKTPKQTVNLLSTGGGRRDMTQRQLDAHSRVVVALGGPRARFADLLVSVCCFDQSAPSVPKLAGALDLLARHYRIR